MSEKKDLTGQNQQASRGQDPLEHEEARLDDAVIGRAFKGSLIVFFALIVVIAGLVYWFNRAPTMAEPEAVEIVEAKPLQTVATLPSLSFKNVTAEMGIQFIHENGASGEKLLPETMGGGVAAFDYDRDGDQDLLFVNSSHWPNANATSRPTSALYRNDGDRFTDVSEAAGLAIESYGMGVAIGDYDGDGDEDVFLTAVGKNRLFENRGGRFVEVTSAARVGGDEDYWSTSAGFFDYDLDGDLDLFVANYVKWSPEIDKEVDFQLAGLGRAYGPPTNFEGRHPYLYQNQGDGTFVEVAESAGLHVSNIATGLPVAKALALCFFDLGEDGDPDVLVANDTTRNFLFENQGDGSFKEIGAVAGVGFDSAGNATGAMGVDAADYRNERMLGLAVANFANEMSSLYVTETMGSAQFSDEAIAEGIGAPSRSRLSFGLFFFDVDLDGRLDLLQANGHLEEDIQKVQSSQEYRQPPQLFWNAGGDHQTSFVEFTDELGGDFFEPLVGRGATYLDFDEDGDLDIVLMDLAGRPRLLENQWSGEQSSLRITLIDDSSGQDRLAIGAHVELVEPSGRVQRRELYLAKSYLSSVEPVLTFGLGKLEQPATYTLGVRWPDGKKTTHEITLSESSRWTVRKSENP